MSCGAHSVNAMGSIPSRSTRQVPPFVKQINTSIIGMTVVSLLFQLMGCVTPGWITFRFTKGYTEIEVGLWYMLECVNGACVSQTLESISSDVVAAVRPFRIETSIALLSCITVLVITIRMARSQATELLTNIPVALLSLLSGILSLASSGRMADLIIHHHTGFLLRSETDNHISLGFPYSLLLTGFGGVLSCAVFLLSLRQIHRLHRQMQQQAYNGLQMSGLVPHGQMIPNAFPLTPATYPTSINPTHQPGQYSTSITPTYQTGQYAASITPTHQPGQYATPIYQTGQYSTARKPTLHTSHERSASFPVDQRSEEGAVLLQTAGTSPDYQNELRDVGTNHPERNTDYSRKLQKLDQCSDNENEYKL